MTKSAVLDAMFGDSVSYPRKSITDTFERAGFEILTMRQIGIDRTAEDGELIKCLKKEGHVLITFDTLAAKLAAIEGVTAYLIAEDTECLTQDTEETRAHVKKKFYSIIRVALVTTCESSITNVSHIPEFKEVFDPQKVMLDE